MSRAPRARTVRNLGDPVAAALLLNSDSGTSCAEQSSGASQSSEGSAISPALLRARLFRVRVPAGHVAGQTLKVELPDNVKAFYEAE